MPAPTLPAALPGEEEDLPYTTIYTAIAVTNGKGGVGKTSVTVNVAGLVGLNESKVLVIDLDPQGDTSKEFGMDGKGGLSLLMGIQTAGRNPLVPVEVRPYVHLLEGGADLQDLILLAGQWGKSDNNGMTAGERLYHALLPLIEREQYDLILIDTPPVAHTIQEMALTIARFVVIPTKSDQFSIDGLKKVADRFRSARRLNPYLDLLGIVLFDSQTNAKRVRERAKTKITQWLGEGDHVFEAYIRHSEAAASDMREEGNRMLVYEYEERAASALPYWEAKKAGKHQRRFSSTATGLGEDYQALTEEIIERMTTKLAGDEESV